MDRSRKRGGAGQLWCVLAGVMPRSSLLSFSPDCRAPARAADMLRLDSVVASRATAQSACKPRRDGLLEQGHMAVGRRRASAIQAVIGTQLLPGPAWSAHHKSICLACNLQALASPRPCWLSSGCAHRHVSGRPPCHGQSSGPQMTLASARSQTQCSGGCPPAPAGLPAQIG